MNKNSNKVRKNLSRSFGGAEENVSKEEILPNVHNNHLDEKMATPVKMKPVDVKGEEENIHQMELLREQIQSMLRHNNAGLEYGKGDDLNTSISSIDTISLLKNASGIQNEENFLMSSLNSSAKEVVQVDTSLIAENNILKESNQRERLRRKQLEEQVQDLQDKLLDCQEQLAVAISTERKKTILIEQLDKTLATIAGGWKLQQQERVAATTKIIHENEVLIHENEVLADSQKRQDEMIHQFEKELREAVTAFQKEQTKLSEVNQNHKKQVEFLEQEKVSLAKQLDEVQASNLHLEEEKEKMLKIKQEMIVQIENVKHTQNQNIGKLEAENNQLIEQLNLMRSIYDEKILQTQNAFDVAHKETQDVHQKLLSTSNAMEVIKRENDALKRERETLKMEQQLLTSQMESLKTKHDSELRSKLEQEFSEQIFEIQNQILATETEIRNSQQKQVATINEKHEQQLERQTILHKQEMVRTKEAVVRVETEYEQRLRECQAQLSEMSQLNRTLENQRSDLVEQLKVVMKSQWQQTLDVLSSNTSLQKEGSDQFSSTFQNITPQQHNKNNFLQKYDSKKHLSPENIPQTDTAGKTPSTKQYPEQHSEVDPISLLYQDVDGAVERCEEKSTQLSHFIEKLLQRSPSQSTERDSLKHQLPEKPLSSSPQRKPPSNAHPTPLHPSETPSKIHPSNETSTLKKCVERASPTKQIEEGVRKISMGRIQQLIESLQLSSESEVEEILKRIPSKSSHDSDGHTNERKLSNDVFTRLHLSKKVSVSGKSSAVKRTRRSSKDNKSAVWK